ncbi:Transcriptional activator of glycolytic enzymes domain containing protein, partial [Rhypophila sp. PSN 637]
AVKTVSDLWREWTTGLQGGPSITALDNRWGSRWSAGRQAEVQWYSLRLEVIREIRRVAGMRRTSEETAVAFVAAEQRQSNCSLDLYCKRLRANRKIREADGTGGGASAGAEGRKGRRTAR